MTMRDNDSIILESIYFNILIKENMDAFEFIKILSSGKQQTLYNPLRGDAGNYINDEGVEVSFKDEAPLVEFDGEEYAGDIELNYIGVEDVEKRNKGAASRELDRIVAEADKHDISIGLTIDPEDVVRGGGKMGLSPEELKSWYQKRGFIFQGRNGYRPRKSEDRSKIEPKSISVDQSDIKRIEDDINNIITDKGGWNHPTNDWSDLESFFYAYSKRNIEKEYTFDPRVSKGYHAIGSYEGNLIYYYDGVNRPIPVNNLTVNFDNSKNSYSVKLKNT